MFYCLQTDNQVFFVFLTRIRHLCVTIFYLIYYKQFSTLKSLFERKQSASTTVIIYISTLFKAFINLSCLSIYNISKETNKYIAHIHTTKFQNCQIYYLFVLEVTDVTSIDVYKKKRKIRRKLIA